MPALSFAEVIEIVKKQDDPIIGHVQDGFINYLVLNAPGGDWVFNDETLDKYEAILTTIESNIPEGPACMVTIATGTKKFSTGFDLAYWKIDVTNAMKTIARCQKIYGRIATLPMPSMCVMNGHAFAGGLLMALAHDFRIMTTNPKSKLCLSEINLGLALPPSYASLTQCTLPPQTARTMALGYMFGSAEALEMRVVSNLFKDIPDAESQVQEFAKVHAPQGQYREAMKLLKMRMFETYVDICNRTVFSPEDIFGLVKMQAKL